MTSSGWWGEATTEAGTVSLRVARRGESVRLVVEGPDGRADVELPGSLAGQLADAIGSALGAVTGEAPDAGEGGETLASTDAGQVYAGQVYAGQVGDEIEADVSEAGDVPDPGRPWSDPLPDEPTIARSREAALEVLREVASGLPETAEVEALGAPTFRVSTRSFAVVEVADGCPVVRVKVSVTDQQRLLADDRYRRDDETGVHGWTSLRIDAVDPDELRSLLITGYRFVAPEHLAGQLGI